MAMGGIDRLNLTNLKTKKPGLLADGGNLYLRTFKAKDGTLTRSWIFRYQLAGMSPRDMGLGSYPNIGLAEARNLATKYRPLLVQGLDPIAHREKLKAEDRAAKAVKPPPTFDESAKDYIATHRASWRNPKHAQQWVNTLKTYASPVIGKLRVNEINVDHVLKVIKPLWDEKTDTMKRVRGRIETVLDFATAMKKREGDNPAGWRGNLKHLLASPAKIAPVEHHAALDYKHMGEFVAQLRQREGIG